MLELWDCSAIFEWVEKFGSLKSLPMIWFKLWFLLLFCHCKDVYALHKKDQKIFLTVSSYLLWEPNSRNLPNSFSSSCPSHRSALGGASKILAGTPKCLATVKTSDLCRSEISCTSTAPSPYLQKYARYPSSSWNF